MKSKFQLSHPSGFASTPDAIKELDKYYKRLSVANRSSATIKNYTRSLEFLMDYYGKCGYELEIDQVIDYLHHLQFECKLKWRTLKIYVAGLRWYYSDSYTVQECVEENFWI